MARKGKKRDLLTPSDLAIAQANAAIKTGPERATLTALIGEARGQLQADLTAAKGGAQSAIRGAKAARKPLRQVYNRALTEADTAHQDVEAAFGTLGAAADPFEAITERELALGRQRIAGAGALAQQELTGRIAEARAGRQFATSKARSQYRADMGKLQDRLRQLGDEEGAQIVSQLGALASERAKAQTQLDVANIYAKPKGKGGSSSTSGGKSNRATTSELRGFKSSFAKALSYAKDYVAEDRSRASAAADLTRGVPKSSWTEGGKKLSDPGVPAIGDQLAIRAALDMAYGGRVSRKTAQALHDIGLKVRDLPGAVSYGRWKRRPEKVGRAVEQQYMSPKY